MTANALKKPALKDEQVLIYPPRDAAKERETLYAEDALSFAALSHYGWGGKRDLREGARILVVGEGSGDATIVLAEQARGTAVEIIAIDVNPQAIALSKARLAKRGLTNVVHHVMSIYDLPGGDLGEFDIIECRHVLDHIEDPVAGLQALGAVLKDDGMMAITLNANYGRLQLYTLQALAQHLIEDYMPRELKVQIIGEFLKALPADHWMGHDSADYVAEINAGGDAAIEALFLQPYNHAFTAADVYMFLDQCGLALTGFMGKARPNYRIESNTQSPKLLELLATKMDYERDIIGDLMHGGIRAHQFYASIQDKVAAAPGDDMVIELAFAADVSELQAKSGAFTNAPELLGRIDGTRTIGTILAELGEARRDELLRLYQNLNLHQLAFLRHKDIKPYISAAGIQARLSGIEPITYQ